MFLTSTPQLCVLTSAVRIRICPDAHRFPNPDACFPSLSILFIYLHTLLFYTLTGQSHLLFGVFPVSTHLSIVLFILTIFHIQYIVSILHFFARFYKISCQFLLGHTKKIAQKGQQATFKNRN